MYGSGDPRTVRRCPPHGRTAEVGLESGGLVALNLVLIYLLAAFVAFGQYDYHVHDRSVSATLGVQAVLALLIAAAVTCTLGWPDFGFGGCSGCISR